MVLVEKWPFFQLFFLGNIGQENVFYDILEQKDAFLGYKNEKSKKAKNWHFSKGFDPWFWSKNGDFSSLFFLGNIGQEKVFYDILERKKSFYAIKTTSSKIRNIDIFPKGLTHGFNPKMAIFPTFIFGQYRTVKCFLRYFRAKRLLSTLWKQEVEKVEKLTFFQRG